MCILMWFPQEWMLFFLDPYKETHATCEGPTLRPIFPQSSHLLISSRKETHFGIYILPIEIIRFVFTGVLGLESG